MHACQGQWFVATGQEDCTSELSQASAFISLSKKRISTGFKETSLRTYSTRRRLNALGITTAHFFLAGGDCATSSSSCLTFGKSPRIGPPASSSTWRMALKVTLYSGSL